MRHTTTALVLAAATLAGCGSGGGAAGPALTATEASTSTSGTNPAGPSTWRTFDVDGATVEVSTPLDALPQRATTVRFTGTLIDSGRGGLELCMGGVEASLPPQCRGPVVEGLDPAGWTETQNGVTWGDRTVTVAWPPTAEGRLTLLGDEPTLLLQPFDDGAVTAMAQLPAACEAIEQFTPPDAMSAYANSHPDQTGALWVTRQGSVVVLGVVEAHVEEARAALSTGGTEPCIVPMRYSTVELQAVQQRLSDSGLSGADGVVLWSGQIGASNQISVGVAVADRATVARIAGEVDDPGMIRVISTAEILKGA